MNTLINEPREPDAAADVSVGAGACVMVFARIEEGRYRRIAQWAVGPDGAPVLMQDPAADVEQAKALLGRLMKHLRGEGDVA